MDTSRSTASLAATDEMKLRSQRSVFLLFWVARENLLHQFLCACWSLDLAVLVVKVVKERLQEFVGVVDPLHVPPHDPDHVRLVGVLPEDVLDDDHRLLDYVVDLGLDQVQHGRQLGLCWPDC